MASGPRVRFAPSPTGSLHLGNARTALFNWLVARGTGGVFVLRIEDTDVDREETGSEAGILEDLRWLGLEWDEGPGAGGAFGPYRQSERSELHRDRAASLLEAGRAYRCFCSAEDLEAERRARREAGLPQRYSGRCRRLSAADVETRVAAGEPFALRFASVPDGAPPEPVVFEDRLRGRVEFDALELGDPVILRPDGRPTYNFAAVVDDAAMRIGLVLRGDDHLSNTPRQVLLYDALGLSRPEFAHLPMVRGADGARLSKRHGAVSVAEYRRSGYPPEALLNALVLLGWSPGGEGGVLDRDEMVARFDLDRVSRSASLFDPDRLAWLSNQHIKLLSVDRLADQVERRLVAAGRLPADGAVQRDWLREVAELVRDSLHTFEEVVTRTEALFASGGRPYDDEAAGALRSEGAEGVVRSLARLAAEEPPETAEGWVRIKKQVQQETQLKGKSLFHPLRAAITGRVSGPELDRLVPLVTRGSGLLPDRIVPVAARAARTAEWLG